jgi:uncharacterized protein (TIGR02186 family)
MMKLLHLSLFVVPVVAALLFAAGRTHAQNILTLDKPLSIDLADRSVDITMGFNGANIALFGTRKYEGDIAVVIRGPDLPATVRRKSQIFGMWMNTRAVTFRNVPIYYDVALSKPEAEFSDKQVLINNKIGINYLDFRPDRRVAQETVEVFKEALIRNRQKEGYLMLEPKRVEFINNEFFRVDFHVPPNVPTGDYVVKTFLIKDDKVLEHRETRMRVAQVGFNAKIYYHAVTNGFMYGLFAVLMALSIGYGSYAMWRKD